MKKPVIAIDVDDVLADNAKGFIEFSNKRWGTNLDVDDYSEHYDEMWQIDHMEAEQRINEFYNSGYISNYDHRSSAGSVLEKLKDNFDLLIITSRRVGSKSATVEWIHAKYPGIFDEQNVHFAGFFDSDDIADHLITHTKGEISKNLGADYIIDDQLKHCIAAAEHGLQALLFGNYPWNQVDDLPTNVQRVLDWSEVLEYFNERG